MKERLDKIKEETGNFFFELGRLHYQVDQDTQEIQDIKTKLHNLKVEALKIKKQMGQEIKLAPAPDSPPPPPEPTLDMSETPSVQQ